MAAAPSDSGDPFLGTVTKSFDGSLHVSWKTTDASGRTCYVALRVSFPTPIVKKDYHDGEGHLQEAMRVLEGSDAQTLQPGVWSMPRLYTDTHYDDDTFFDNTAPTVSFPSRLHMKHQLYESLVTSNAPLARIESGPMWMRAGRKVTLAFQALFGRDGKCHEILDLRRRLLEVQPQLIASDQSKSLEPDVLEFTHRFPGGTEFAGEEVTFRVCRNPVAIGADAGLDVARYILAGRMSAKMIREKFPGRFDECVVPALVSLTFPRAGVFVGHNYELQKRLFVIIGSFALNGEWTSVKVAFDRLMNAAHQNPPGLSYDTEKLMEAERGLSLVMKEILQQWRRVAIAGGEGLSPADREAHADLTARFSGLLAGAESGDAIKLLAALGKPDFRKHAAAVQQMWRADLNAFNTKTMPALVEECFKGTGDDATLQTKFLNVLLYLAKSGRWDSVMSGVDALLVAGFHVKDLYDYFDDYPGKPQRYGLRGQWKYWNAPGSWSHFHDEKARAAHATFGKRFAGFVSLEGTGGTFRLNRGRVKPLDYCNP